MQTVRLLLYMVLRDMIRDHLNVQVCVRAFLPEPETNAQCVLYISY